MHRRLIAASAMAVVVTAALLSGSGTTSSAAVVRDAQRIPARLAAAIHARLGAAAIRSSSATPPADGPFFGVSVAVSADGTTALVGAPNAVHGKGAAYVFHVSGAGSWSSSHTPTADLSDNEAESFGAAVALSADGTTAFVGAPDTAGSYDVPPGVIDVFHVSAEDAWVSTSTPAATLTVNHGYAAGVALALSPDGTTLVSGAPALDQGAGGAYVFHVSSEDAWASNTIPTATLSNAGANPDDRAAGLAVAISGDGTTALVGDSFNPSGGGAWLYHVSAADAWTSSSTPTAILSDANSAQGDALGFALALSGDGTVALLGAPSANAGTGEVDVFHTSAEDAWASTSTPTATLIKWGLYVYFGLGVALSSDGTTALVTAPARHDRRGAAYIFRVADEGAWTYSSSPTAALTNSDGQAHDVLGLVAAISADGATALVGAPGFRFETGAADVFHESDASSWASSSTPTAILTDSALSRCLVPSLKGLKLRAAKAALKARSCRLGRVRRVQHAKGRRGRVLSQSRTPGFRVPVGTKVSVKVKK